MTGPPNAGTTVRTPGTAETTATSESGTPLAPCCSLLTRTSTPLAASAKMLSNVRCRVSVKTKEPVTNAVPSTTDRTVSSSRTLWAARLRRATLRMGFALMIGSPYFAVGTATASNCFIRSSTESAVGSRISSTMRPSARNTTRSA